MVSRDGWTLFALLTICAPVSAADPCILQQITDSEDGFSGAPVISGDGSSIAFTSSADLLGTNPDGGKEVFLWRPPGELSQLTDTVGSGSGTGDIDEDGNRVVLVSRSDLTGMNPDGRLEVFLWDEATGLSQVTDSGPFYSQSPSIDGSGTTIAFSSRADFTGQNGSFGDEIFLWEEGAGIQQVTDFPNAHCSFPAVSSDGTHVSLDADPDLLDGSSNRVIFLWNDVDGLTQLTSVAAGTSLVASLDGAGGAVAFQSTADLTGGNADGSLEIFRWTLAEGFLQLTEAPDGLSWTSDVSADGRRVVFHSNADVVGSNEGGNEEIVLWDEEVGVVALTDAPFGHSLAPSISDDGRRIAFQSGANLTGENADGNTEVFVAVCPASFGPSALEIPTLSPSWVAAFALLLAAAASGVLARS